MEMRQPFNDYRLVQHAFSTPETLRLRGNKAKHIHVMAMQDLMPTVVLERTNKAEFSVVFRNHLDAMSDVFTKTIPRDLLPWVTPDGMERLFHTYRRCPELGGPMWVLWSTYGSELTLRKPVSVTEPA